ncbi:hypothetical protein CS022_06765 [Veronia nyctiphanis]|uniref:Uncharacterized protein n=1 Tax=Veronia nyctiphanis TaxID=1278244 RepID=A0A4Q0YXP0_9GAMM|nr:hypothetical protein [Veronia nyctiphanis]RXJ73969.1 hypothetical protein CS022_06765 [Veronia nyctiphanis]
MPLDTFICLTLTLSTFTFLIKRVYKVKFSVPDKLNVGDFTVIAALSLLATFTPAWLNLPILLTIFTILWVDSLLMFCFGMKVSLDNARTFSQGVETFKGEFKDVLFLLARFHWMLASYLFFLSSTFYILSGVRVLLPVSIGLLLLCITKSKLKNASSVLAWSAVFALLILGDSYFAPEIPTVVPFLFVLSFLLYCAVKEKKFLSFKSIFHGLLLGTSLKKGRMSEGNQQILNEIERSYEGKTETNRTQHFGSCEGFNVLLFTIESMSDEAFQDSPIKDKIFGLLENKAT